VSHAAKGILGETLVPTRDSNGMPIMAGLEAIRGQHEDCKCPLYRTAYELPNKLPVNWVAPPIGPVLLFYMRVQQPMIHVARESPCQVSLPFLSEEDFSRVKTYKLRVQNSNEPGRYFFPKLSPKILWREVYTRMHRTNTPTYQNDES